MEWRNNHSAGRNPAIDFFKYVAALCIIGIHTQPFYDFNARIYFAVVQIFCRLAVPYFAVCTGFFMTAKYIENGEIKRDAGFAPVLKQWKRLLRIYLLWSALYLVFSIPGWIRTGWFSAGAFLDFGIATVKQGSYYHLWYLLSVIYALPLLYLCIRWIDRRYWLCLSMGLYAVKALMYGYRNWLPGGVQRIFSVFDWFSGMTDAAFLLLPMMLIGAVFAEKPEKRTTGFYIGGAVCSLALLSIEASLLHMTGQENVSYIFLTYPTAYFVFAVVANMQFPMNYSVCTLLGSASLFMYCFHPMLAKLLESCLAPTARFFVVALVSTLTGLLYAYIGKRIREKKVR